MNSSAATAANIAVPTQHTHLIYANNSTQNASGKSVTQAVEKQLINPNGASADPYGDQMNNGLQKVHTGAKQSSMGGGSRSNSMNMVHGTANIPGQ